MLPEIEQSLSAEFDELYSLRDRLRQIADHVRERFVVADLADQLEAEIYDDELELRGTEESSLLIRLNSYHLEITGVRPGIRIHLMAAIILEEAGAFRFTWVEAGFSLTVKVRRERPLDLVQKAFSTFGQAPDTPMLDRRFSMTWEWGSATVGYSFFAGDTEDRELFLSFKAREGYLKLPELQEGVWITIQARYFEALVSRFIAQLGWAV